MHASEQGNQARCDDCPIIRSELARTEELDSETVDVLRKLDNLRLRKYYDTFAKRHPDFSQDVLLSLANAALAEMRGFLAEELEDIEDDIHEREESMDAYSANCPHPIKAHILAGMGQVVTVTVCGSPLALDGEHIEPVVVNREMPLRDVNSRNHHH